MARIFTANNATGAAVYDVDTKRKLAHVMSVNIDTGEVECAEFPYRLSGHETKVETFALRFDSIHPIYGGRLMPQLFHCYGLKA